MPQEVVEGWFDDLLQQIIQAIHDILNQVEVDDGRVADYMLIVGGFGGSPYLIAKLRNACGRRVGEVVCPGVPSQAVLKGNVIGMSMSM